MYRSLRHLLCISLVFLMFVVSLGAQTEPYHHEVKTVNGDGAYSLLRRYKLGPSACQIAKFYEINKLEKDATLKADKNYLLPVLIYTYNGKSIRSTIGINDWELAIKIKEYNEYLFEHKLRRTKYTDSKILWVPYGLVDCNEEIRYKGKNSAGEGQAKSSKSKETATKGAIKVERLFGPKYQDVEILDTKLAGHVYYLVSGHGGPDPGTQCLDCPTTLCEDEYAYDVILRLARDFIQHGAKVHIIVQDKNDGIRDGATLKCDKDEVYINNIKIPAKQKPRLVTRASQINALYRQHKAKGAKVQKTIIVHVDSNQKNKRLDTYFMYAKGSKVGKQMALDLQNIFKQKYAKYQKNRGYSGSVSQRGWYMLNYTQPPAVYIELGNIKNAKDRKRITIDSNRQALANWMFEGVTGIRSD